MYHAIQPATHPTAGHPKIPQNDLLRNFSLHVETYAHTKGCYPLAEPWYTGERIDILQSRVMTNTQLVAFEDELHAHIQEELSSLCAAV